MRFSISFFFKDHGKEDVCIVEGPTHTRVLDAYKLWLKDPSATNRICEFEQIVFYYYATNAETKEERINQYVDFATAFEDSMMSNRAEKVNQRVVDFEYVYSVSWSEIIPD